MKGLVSVCDHFGSIFERDRQPRGKASIHRLRWIMASYHPISCSGGDVEGLVVLEYARPAAIEQICTRNKHGQSGRGM